MADRGCFCILTFPSHLPARPSASPGCISHPASSSRPVALLPSDVAVEHRTPWSLFAVYCPFFFFFLFILVGRGGCPQLKLTPTCSTATLTGIIPTFPLHAHRFSLTPIWGLTPFGRVRGASWDVAVGGPASRLAALLGPTSTRAWGREPQIREDGHRNQSYVVLGPWRGERVAGISGNTASLVRSMAS